MYLGLTVVSMSSGSTDSLPAARVARGGGARGLTGVENRGGRAEVADTSIRLLPFGPRSLAPVPPHLKLH